MWGLALTCLSWLGLNPLPYLAAQLSATEPALKLLLTLLMSYPLAIVYHKYVRPKEELRNIYFLVTGLDMAFYNFGFSMYHNAVPVFVLYFTTMALGPGRNNAIFTFVFNMTYLLIAYANTESENYDITWTMPHCVLTLKLSALAFDLWDGAEKAKGTSLSVNSQKTALEKAPTFMELFGFVYFPSCFLVGPIFSFRRYSDFINEKFPLDSEKDVYEGLALQRFVQGILYLAAFQIGVSVFNIQYMLSDEFWDRSIFYRHFYCGLWAHFALYKYISCWLITEASAIRFGLSYNGTETISNREFKTVSKWDGCSNIKLIRFESATKFQHYIDSFNCNTNHFAAEYVYKRLKFLGNRQASQFFTLVFLAMWHGTQSGYYMTFLNEFLIIFMEKGLESILNKLEIYHKLWANKVAKYIFYVVLKTYTIVFMGWSLVPFDVKMFSKWWSIYYSLYFSGFILFVPWGFVYQPLLIAAVKKLQLKKVETSRKQE